MQGVKLGFIAALFALVGLAFAVYYLDQYIPTLGLITDYFSLGYVALFIVLISFLITWLSTFFATQRFLNLQTNDLYY